MSQSADRAIQRWADVMMGRETRFLSASNIVSGGDRLYSYGTHFELARPLRDKAGEIHSFLLNGDTYSNTTTGHQSSVRGALSRTGKQLVIIPYEALEGAGINRDTIQVVHVLPDRMERIDHHYTEMQPGWVWKREDIMAYVDLTPQELQAIADERTAKELEEYARHLDRAKEDPDGYWATTWLPRHPQPPEPFPVDKISDWERRAWRKTGERMVLYTSSRRGAQEITVETDDDGVTHYEWTTHRHWLGESLIRARVDWRTQHRCTTCDGTGRGIGPTRSRWADSMPCPDCRGAGGTTKDHHRWAYYLSGFDHEEARPLYFLCELPRGSKPATVAEAYEALKPEPVKMAEQMGRPVERQGDIFAIPTTLDAKVLKAKGARVERRKVEKDPDRPWRKLGHFPYILSTNHTATEVAYLPDGVTLARGTMYHDPDGRNQDHARHKLGDGKTWHIVIKNTVPTTVRR